MGLLSVVEKFTQLTLVIWEIPNDSADFLMANAVTTFRVSHE